MVILYVLKLHKDFGTIIEAANPSQIKEYEDHMLHHHGLDNNNNYGTYMKFRVNEERYNEFYK